MSTVTDERTGIELLYRGRSLKDVAFEQSVVHTYNSVADELDLEPITDVVNHSTQFNIPPHYLQLDVEQHVMSLIAISEDAAVTKQRLERTQQELSLYKARNLYPVLQLMIYIVDTMRQHNIVWGVGRGSSVASYVLYLIGVHRIDSIKYQLDIREFLK